MKKILLAMAVMVISLSVKAQIESPVKWSYAAKKISATEAIVYLKATMQDGWHIYSLNVKEGGPIKTSFKFDPSKDYAAVGKPTEPKPIAKNDPNFKMTLTYFEKEVVFSQKIKLNSPNVTEVKGKLEYMTCNDHKCLPPDDINFTVPLGK